MFHDDVQTQFTNNWKRNTDEHPIDRIFTIYFNANNQIRNPPSNTRSNSYKSETKHIIQRQRVLRSFLNKRDEIISSIRKPITIDIEPKFLSITSMSSPQILFSESNEQSTNNNNRQQTIKKELDRPSSLFIRGHRPTIENLSPNPQVLDMRNISENQLSLTIPPNFLFRNKPSRVFLSNKSSFKTNDRISTPRIKPSNYSKTVNEVKQILFHPKSIHRNNSLPTPIWTPTLTEQDLTHTRTLGGILRSKSHLSKFFRNRQSQKIQSERKNTNLKPTDIQDLYISPRLLNNPQHESEMNKNTCNKGSIVDESVGPKSNNDGVSDDDDEPISADGNSSTSTCISQTNVEQYHHRSSSFVLSDPDDTFSSRTLFTDNSKSKIPRLSTKKSIPRRRAHKLTLPPVTEDVDANETDTKKILEKIYALHNDDFNENKFERSFDDDNSLTFQLLNQHETEFEKKLSKLRKFEFKKK